MAGNRERQFCGVEEETTIHILYECEALSNTRRQVLDDFLKLFKNRLKKQTSRETHCTRISYSTSRRTKSSETMLKSSVIIRIKTKIIHCQLKNIHTHVYLLMYMNKHFDQQLRGSNKFTH